MTRASPSMVEVQGRKRLPRSRMCARRLNSRCTNISVGTTSWTSSGYEIRWVDTTAVAVRVDRKFARRRSCCTFLVRNRYASDLRVVQSLILHQIQRNIGWR